MPAPEPDPAAWPRPRQMLAVAAIGIAAALLVLRWTTPAEPAGMAHSPAAPAPPALPPRSEPTPVAPLPTRLSEALDLMADGRLREAQRLMVDFRRGPDAAALPPEHRETMAAVLARLADDPVLAAALELERGFADADLKRLRLTLGSLTRQQMIALRRDPQAARRIDDARRLAAEVDAIEARLGSDRLAALRLAQDFRRRHPRFAAALDFERRAVTAIDETAGRLIAANRLDEARALLLELKLLRPGDAAESPRVEARLAAIDEVFKRRNDLEATVRELEILGWERPHEALDLLAGMERTAANRDRFAQLESTLTMLMEDLDASGPEVEVLVPERPEATAGVYERDGDVVVRVRASDDYEVITVRFLWRWFDRDAAGEVVEAPLRAAARIPSSEAAAAIPSGATGPRSGAAAGAPSAEATGTVGTQPAPLELEARITVAQHQGRNLQFWAEAVDRGGRTARSDEIELRPERRGFLRRLGLRRNR